jgi:Ni,Fe-hydrogenase I cytochrome b subunit
MIITSEEVQNSAYGWLRFFYFYLGYSLLAILLRRHYDELLREKDCRAYRAYLIWLYARAGIFISVLLFISAFC